MSAGHLDIPTLTWQHGGVRVACSTRHGGASSAPYEHLNLGLHVGDDAVVVGANRAALADVLGLDRAMIRTAAQVHGVGVWVDGEDGPPAEADALVTMRGSGNAVAVLVADCAPVVIATPTQVAAIHAGWRGMVAGVIEATLEHLDLGEPGDTRAVIGPCIGPCCFEVGEDVADRFHPSSRRAGRGERPHVDQRAEVVRRLAAHGIECDVLDICTSCDERFFSHRRATGREGAATTGRQAVVAWFAAPA